MAANVVPSFASFPAFDDSNLDSPDNTAAPPPAKRSKHRKHTEEATDKPRKNKHKHNKHRQSDATRRDDELHAASTSQLFYSDRKGDTMNTHYDGLHQGSVAKYKLVDRGKHVLGLSKSYTVVARRSKGIEVAIYTGKRKSLPELTDSKARALLSVIPVRLPRLPPNSQKYVEHDGFIRLRNLQRKKGDGHGPSYRSITRNEADMAGDSESSESDASVSESSDDEEDGQLRLSSHQEALKRIEQDLTANPGSSAAWMSLLTRTLANVPLLSKNASKTRAEVTLSILQRAFHMRKENACSPVLRLKFLRSGEEVWDERKIAEEYEKAFLDIKDTDLRLEWLDWKIRKAKDDLASVFESAKRIMDGIGDVESRDVEKVRVFWRLAIAIQQAGYVERAMAMFQAQAELTFEIPRQLFGLPLPSLLDGLSEYWDADLPRIGEKESKGWEHWVTSGKPDSDIALPPAMAANLPDSSDAYTSWAFSESHGDHHLCFPSHSQLSEDVDDDPYRTVLFDDIREALFILRSSEGKRAFRLVWLSFLGLAVPGISTIVGGNVQDHRWNSTHLVQASLLNNILPPRSPDYPRVQSSESQAGVLVGQEREFNSSFGPVKSWVFGLLGPLDNFFGRSGLWTKKDVEGLNLDALRAIFRQLRMGDAEDIEWDALALAFEGASNIKSAIKLSRSFLASLRDSTLHWAAHASLERIRGKPLEARKVYETVLASDNQIHYAACLYWEWAEMEWLSGNRDQAVGILLRSVGSQSIDGVHLLRARRTFAERCSDTRHWQSRYSWIRAQALFDLLTSGDMTSALSSFDRYLENEVPSSLEHECLTVSSLLLVYHYLIKLKNPGKPSVLRDRVNKALELYSSNSIVIGLFLEGEKGQGVWGRVRTFLGESENADKGVVRRAIEVWIPSWEKGRWEAEVERTRSGLLTAVESESGKYSPVLWRLFLEFEIRAGALQNAKKLLYRALGECPLVKDLYLLAFGPLRSVFSTQELHDFVDTMADRGIRMRQSLDDVVQVATADEPVLDAEDALDEIEYNAEELRRLRPY